MLSREEGLSKEGLKVLHFQLEAAGNMEPHRRIAYMIGDACQMPHYLVDACVARAEPG